MSKEAMKMALEALEDANNFIIEVEGEDAYRHAITALEEALAKQEQGEPVALKVYRGELCYKSQADDQSFGMWCPVTQDFPFPEGTKFYATPQPKQEQGEPVAWMYDCGNGGRMYAEDLDASVGWLPLYTTPQQRTWVGLTNEEFIYFCSYVRSDVLSEIEEKLMEKNT